MYRVITYSDAGEQVAALVAEALLCYAEVFDQRRVDVLLVQWVG